MASASYKSLSSKRRLVFSHVLFFTFFLFSVIPSFAAGGDLALPANNITFSTSSFLEGKAVRIYARVDNNSQVDLRGVVRFFDDKDQIQGDQPVSVVGGKDDTVFVDWTATPGDHEIKAIVVPFDNDADDSANNTALKAVTVFADTDRDGIPNKDDPDDDNDGTPDAHDAFPLQKSEWVDSDGDTIGNNKDEDDDNDGVKDTDDGVPLNANETVDTDKDGLGNNEDTDDDGDGVSDQDEVARGTAPLKVDTDGDGVRDLDDAFPLDPAKAHDYNRNGIADAADPDADSDGIPKTIDINDTNVGPTVIITTTDSKSPPFLVATGQKIELETTQSKDPDGEVKNTEWIIKGKKLAGEKATALYTSSGFHRIIAKVTDDKGESREETITILVVPPGTPWIALSLLMIALILAIFYIFSYSRSRRL